MKSNYIFEVEGTEFVIHSNPNPAPGWGSYYYVPAISSRHNGDTPYMRGRSNEVYNEITGAMVHAQAIAAGLHPALSNAAICAGCNGSRRLRWYPNDGTNYADPYRADEPKYRPCPACEGDQK